MPRPRESGGAGRLLSSGCFLLRLRERGPDPKDLNDDRLVDMRSVDRAIRGIPERRTAEILYVRNTREQSFVAAKYPRLSARSEVFDVQELLRHRSPEE